MATSDDRRQAYIDAYERWQSDLMRLHSVLIDGQPLDPMHRVALLRSESHTHDRYEGARARFLRIGTEPPESPFGDEGKHE
ncbi:MAG TPA: hypothetical protein VK821_06310 [Dehalococcoidia bacterium]|nr:hypothetical protein [Dehalococcoidia bacterium]